MKIHIRILSIILLLGIVISELRGIAFVNAASNRKIWEDNGYKITVVEQSKWENGSVAEVTIQNIGSEPIKNWQVKANFSNGAVENAWNVTTATENDGIKYTCKEFNRIIAVGEKVTFGYQMQNGSLEGIESMKLTQKTSRMNQKDDYEVSFRITSEWAGHAIVEAVIYNYTEKEIEDWKLSMKFNAKIENIWNAAVLNQDMDQYELGNMGYNAVIGIGQSAAFGFQADFGEASIQCPSETELSSVTEEKEREQIQGNHEESKDLEDEDFDPENDIKIYNKIDNIDWNMDMIGANSPTVEKEKKNPKDVVRVALLDSGINYSDEVDVTGRQNFIPGEDEVSPLYEDFSGHGTAIAEVLAANPAASEEESEDSNIEVDENGNVYEYKGETVQEEGNAVDESTEDDGDEDNFIIQLMNSGYEWTEGVNPNVDLISGRILDENNETTVERTIEAIDWAIENDSDIISMSFGMDEDDAGLHKAVKRAAKKGILLVASAGNGKKVAYPAAYPEVMAVGAVDSMAEKTPESPEGKEIEVVAPGEFIVSRGLFDTREIFSGSSMAVPHVVGLASLLWQKDTGKSAQFIRQLIDSTAQDCGENKKYGYGVIDCEEAFRQYDTFQNVYEENQVDQTKDDGSIDNEIEETISNDSEIHTDAGVRKLYGNWGLEKHKAFAVHNLKENLKNRKKLLITLRKAVTFVDMAANKKFVGMKAHPWFHGYYRQEKKYSQEEKDFVKLDEKDYHQSNYLASYHYLVQLAEQMYENGALTLTKPSDFKGKNKKEVKTAIKGINKVFANKKPLNSKNGSKWEKLPNCSKEREKNWRYYRSILIFGMALHSATDIFAHSTYECVNKVNSKKKKVKWAKVAHPKAYKDKDKKFRAVFTKADVSTERNSKGKIVEKRRYRTAKKVAKNIMSSIDKDFGKKDKNGYKKNASSPGRFFVQKDKDNNHKNYYYLRYSDYLYKVNDSKGSVLSRKYVENAYAMGLLRRYVKQVKSFCTEKEYDKLKTMAGDLTLKVLKKKMNKFQVQKFKLPGIGVVQVKSLAGETVLKENAKTKELECIVSKDAVFKITMADKKKQICCCVIRDGKVYDGKGNEIIEDLVEETGEESDGEEYDELVDMCEVREFTCRPMADTIRMELEWEKKGMDLDSVMNAMFIHDESFYLTYFVEKAANPDLGEVFQCNPLKAGIDRDVQDAGEKETLTIYDVREEGLYLMMVRNYTGDSTFGSKEDLSNSGAVVKLYYGEEKTPFRTYKVPKGSGYYWNIGVLDGKTGEFIPVNTVTEEIWGYEP